MADCLNIDYLLLVNDVLERPPDRLDGQPHSVEVWHQHHTQDVVVCQRGQELMHTAVEQR